MFEGRCDYAVYCKLRVQFRPHRNSVSALLQLVLREPVLKVRVTTTSREGFRHQQKSNGTGTEVGKYRLQALLWVNDGAYGVRCFPVQLAGLFHIHEQKSTETRSSAATN